MGFPDDGYDYLKHMRAPGRSGRANLEGAGPMADPAGHKSLPGCYQTPACRSEGVNGVSSMLRQRYSAHSCGNSCCAGPSVFVPATEQQTQLEDDARIYDASQLSLHQPAADEVSCAHMQAIAS